MAPKGPLRRQFWFTALSEGGEVAGGGNGSLPSCGFDGEAQRRDASDGKLMPDGCSASESSGKGRRVGAFVHRAGVRHATRGGSVGGAAMMYSSHGGTWGGERDRPSNHPRHTGGAPIISSAHDAPPRSGQVQPQPGPVSLERRMRCSPLHGSSKGQARRCQVTSRGDHSSKWETRGRMGLLFYAGVALLLLLIDIVVASGQAAAPPPPSQIYVTLVSTTTATVVWDAVPSASAYRVLKSDYTVGPFLPDFDVRAPPLVAPSTTYTLGNLVTGRLVYIAIASGSEDLEYSTDMSPVATALPIGPPTSKVTGIDTILYNTSVVSLTWQLPGAASQSGPVATDFAAEYSCNGALTVLYPIEFTNLRATIVIAGGITMDAPCTFSVLSRNLNYEPSDPWSLTSENAGLIVRSDPGTIVMFSAPGEPQTLEATGATLSSITVVWTADLLAKATMYQVSYAVVQPGGSRGPELVWSTDVTGLTDTVGGLIEGRAYDITVRARNKNDAGYVPGKTITLSVENVPAAPSSQITGITATTVEVSWSPPPSTHLLSYEVYYQTLDMSGPLSFIAVPGDLVSDTFQQSITGLSTGTPYRISVRAGNLYDFGPFTNLSVTPFAAPTVAPASATASLHPKLSQSVAMVSWAPVDFADFYKIERQEFDEASGTYAGAYVDLGSFYGTQANTTLLLADTTYRFRVSAGNPAGFDPVGTVSNEITTTGVRQPAEAVTDLLVIGSTDTSLNLEWAQSRGELSITEAYRLEVSTSSSFPSPGTTTAPEVINPYLGSAAANVTNSSVVEAPPKIYGNVTGLTVGTRYFVRVTPRSANRTGYEGVPSAATDATPVLPATLPVQGLQVVSILDGAASLEWLRVSAEPIIMYELKARVAGTDTIQVMLEVPQPDNSQTRVSVDVQGLTDGLEYDFIVTPRTLNVAAYSLAQPAFVLGLSFMGVPSPPVGLRVTFVGNDSVSLAWEAAATFPPATSYQVKYRIGRVDFSANGIAPTPDQALTVYDLKRGFPYEFKVFGGTLAGFETQGSATTFATPQFQPLPVGKISVLSIGSGSVSFSWQPPVYPLAFSYRIDYGSNRSAITQVPFFVATGLEPGVPISFTIYAGNVNSLGFEPVGITAILTPMPPPGAVDVMQVTGVTTTTVFLEFPPETLDNVTAYMVQYRRSQDTQWINRTEVICREDAMLLHIPPICPSSFEVPSLVMGVQYDIRVLLRNANDVGYRDVGTIVTAVPIYKPSGAADNIQLYWMSTSQLTLVFDPPAGIDTPTRYEAVYSLQYDNGTYAPELVSDEVIAPVTEGITINGLEFNRTYRVYIIGRNLNTDLYTDAVRSNAFFGVPSDKPPRTGEVIIDNVTSTSVSLHWTPPAGDVTMYRIEVSDDTAFVDGRRVRLSEFGLAPDFQVAGYTTGTSFVAESAGTVVLQPGLPILVRVSARNLNVDGYGEGSIARATPMAPPPSPPRNLTLVSVTTGTVYFTWETPEGYMGVGDETVTKYKVEGCAENCGTDELFPPVALTGQKWYVLGGSEYEYNGNGWVLTGNTFWRTVDIVPYYVLEYNVSQVDGQDLQVGNTYEFRVSAGNANSVSFGPSASIRSATPVFVPSQPREVVASNPKNSEIALNFVPPLETPTNSEATLYKVLVINELTGESYYYPEIIEVTSQVLTGFLYGTKYSLRVFAGNLNGFETVGRLSSNPVTTTAQPCTKACCDPDAAICSSCCGLGFSRSLSGTIAIFWTALTNLDSLQYTISRRIFGTSTAFSNTQTVYGSEFTLTGLDFANPGWSFQIRGGQRAANTVDDIRVAVTLTVPVVTPEPRDVLLAVQSVSNTSITTTWQRPFVKDGGFGSTLMEIRYLVEVSSDNYAGGSMINTRQYGPLIDRQNNDTIVYEAKGLIAGETYSVRVRILTPFMASWDDAFTSAVLSLSPSAQPGPVQDLRASATTLDSIVFSWGAPINFASPPTAYKVTWTPDATTGANNATISGSETSYNITDLDPSVIYTITVRARNLNYRGYEEGVSASGQPQAPPNPPLSLRPTAILSDGVDVRWDAPSGGAPPTGYQVQCRTEGDPTSPDIDLLSTNCKSGPASSGGAFIDAGPQLPTTARTATISGLRVNVAYQFRVCTRGLSTLGSVCGRWVRATPSDPMAPVTLQVESVTESSISIAYSMASSTLPWSFLPLYDFPGNNLYCTNNTNGSSYRTVDYLLSLCLADAACVGFSTDGCLKSALPGESSMVAYTNPDYSIGECCTAALTGSYGCTTEGEELMPAPACGCFCKGIFRKEIRYLVQMSLPPGPFANVLLDGWGVEGGTDGFSLSASLPPGCVSCSACPAACVQVTGLTLGVSYEFRVFVRDLQASGFSGISSNVVSAKPEPVPNAAVTDLSLAHTTVDSIVMRWTGVAPGTESVTGYRVQVSLDGVTWLEDQPAGVILQEVLHLGEGVTHEASASMLTAGTLYYIRVRPRNLNSLGPVSAPGSNVVSAIPFDQIAPVEGLLATSVTACQEASCGCACCAANLCRGTGTVTLEWLPVEGPVTSFRVQTAIVTGGVVGTYTTALTLPPGSTSAVVPNLIIGRDYSFKVQAGSNYVVEWMPDCTISTPAGTPCPSAVVASPYTPPTVSVLDSLLVVRVTDTTVRLRWSQLTSEPATLYRVTYGTDIENPYESVFAEIQPNPLITSTVTGLSPGVPYFFAVTPRNLNPVGWGDGDLGYSACPTTAPGVSWTHLGGGTYTVSWQAPNWPILTADYRVWVRLNESASAPYNQVGSLHVPYSAYPLTATIPNLSPTTAYTFLVTPDSPPCAMIGPIFPTPTPPPVPSFQPIDANATTITTSWGVPMSENGEVVDLYELAFALCPRSPACDPLPASCDLQDPACPPPPEANFTVVANIPSSAPRLHVFENLQVYKTYSLRVRAVNQNAMPMGSPTYITAEPTNRPDRPPTGVFITHRSNIGGDEFGASISLSWTKPEMIENGSNTTFYMVDYWQESNTSCYYRGDHPGPVPCPYVTRFPGSFSTTTGVISGLRPDTSYYFKVYAGNPAGLDASGSMPAGPFMTSKMPAAVTDLVQTSAASTLVNLDWVLPLFPDPSRLLAQVVRDSRVVQSVTYTCTPVSPCPTNQTWNNLETGKPYTFRVYTGTGDDPLVTYPPNRYATVNGSYTGFASLEGGAFQTNNPPATVSVPTWTASAMTIEFEPPVEDPNKAPVLYYTVRAAVGSDALGTTSAPSQLPASATSVYITTVNGAALASYDGTAATEYTAEVTAWSNSGSAATTQTGIKLYVMPSAVQNLRVASGPAYTDLILIEWDAPVAGAVSGIGFEYHVEVSDDEGVNYYRTHTLALGVTSATVSLIPKPGSPSRLHSMRGYIVRISAVNANSGGNGPYTSLRAFTSSIASAVQGPSLSAVSDTHAHITWNPATFQVQELPPVPHPAIFGVRYAIEASVFASAPVFAALPAPFAAISDTSAVVPLADVLSSLTAASIITPANTTRFYFRIVPTTDVGSRLRPTVLLDVQYGAPPTGTPSNLTLSALSAGTAILAWSPPSPEEAALLNGYRIRISNDGVNFEDEPTLISPAGGTSGSIGLINGDAGSGGKVWAQVVQEKAAGPSLSYAAVGPAVRASTAPIAHNLRISGLTATSVTISWDPPSSPVEAWLFSYRPVGSGAAPTIAEVSGTLSDETFSGLTQDTAYTFTVRARALAGEGDAIETIGVLTAAPTSPATLVVLSEGAGGCIVAWTGSDADGAVYRITGGAADSSGNLVSNPAFVSDGQASPEALIPQMQPGSRFKVSAQLKTLHTSGYTSATEIFYAPLGLPGAPENVTVISVRDTSVDVSINPPSSGGDFSRFKIVSTKVTGGGGSQPITQYTNSPSSPPLVVQIGILDPSQDYSIVVSACGRAGCTAIDTPIVAVTSPRQVVNIEATAVTDTTVTLGWSVPEPAGLAYTYRVRYRSVGLSVSSTFVTNDGKINVAGSPENVGLQYGAWQSYQDSDSAGAGTTATVTGLTRNQAYQFAVESVYLGVASAAMVYVARPVDPPLALDSSFLTVSPDSFGGIRRDNITIVWKPPAGSEVTLYKISYWDKASPLDVTTVEVDRFEKNANPDGIGNNYLTLTGLTPYSYYAVKVQARNLNTAGYNAGVTMDTPTINGVEPIPVDQPGKVKDLAIPSVTPVSISVSWAAPPSPHAYFLSNLQVQVYYAPATYNATTGEYTVTGNDTLASTVALATDTQTVITSLTFGALYRVTVRARNNNALGYEPGAVVYGGPTAPCSPCTVRNLRIAAYSGSTGVVGASISLMWDTPELTSPHDRYWYKVELVDGGNPPTSFVTTENDDISATSLRFTTAGFTPIFLGTAYTLRVTARNFNLAGYGTSSEIVVTGYEQPSALIVAPTVAALTTSTVTLQWFVPSTGGIPPEHHSFKITWRLAGSTGLFSGQGVPGGGVIVQATAGQSTAQGTVEGLVAGIDYEFKVFTRNFHENGFEGKGSPTVIGSPKAPPPPPVNLRLSSATTTSVTVSWEPPPGATDLTTYKVLFGSAPYDPLNTTAVEAPLITEHTITGLVEGQIYYITVYNQDLAGWSEPDQIPARPIDQATGPTNTSVQAIASGNTLITWQPPMSLTQSGAIVTGGLSISGYQIEARVPYGDPSGTWTVLGTTTGMFYMHEDVGTFGVTLYYAVRAVIQQDPSFGPLNLPGLQSTAQVYFGKKPEWIPGSAEDGGTYHVPFESTLYIPLHVNASDAFSGSLSFRTVEGLPPTAAWGMPQAGATSGGIYLSQNLTVAYDTYLAGSTYVTCVTSRDANGLEAPLRCINIVIPRPEPRLVSPADGTRYYGRIGCPLTIHVVAEDRTSANMQPSLAHSLGYTAGVSPQTVSISSRYRTVYGQSLPAGASISPMDPSSESNPATFLLNWRPSKGQEAFDYNICMVASGARDGEPGVCVVVSVLRCQFCAAGGDTLQTMAQLFHASWSVIWSGNHMVTDPDNVAIGEVISLGPTYHVAPGDDVDHIASRFGASLEDVLLWNPDIGDAAAADTGYELWELQEMCILPNTCVYDASTGQDPLYDGLLDSYEPRIHEPLGTPSSF